MAGVGDAQSNDSIYNQTFLGRASTNLIFNYKMEINCNYSDFHFMNIKQNLLIHYNYFVKTLEVNSTGPTIIRSAHSPYDIHIWHKRLTFYVV